MVAASTGRQAPVAPRAGGSTPPTLAALPPLALYVHVPWCVRKCPYCDFNSHAVPAGDALPEARYLDALARDLESSLPQVWGRRVHSVFIGGGTPSLLSAAGLDRLLADIRARLPLDPGAEITLEANPGTVEAARFAAYRASGVNRLSIGIQSFDARHLRALGRIHDGDESRRAAAIAREVFDNFNLDLMYALPGQTVAELERDLDAALSFAPPHLSVYHLTLEPNTVFAKYPPALPDDDAAADMQVRVEAVLGAAGYARYETSAYARPGARAAHNLNYWRFGDYLGIGAGAHGKISFPDRIVRTEKPRNPDTYMAACAAAEAGAAIGSVRAVATADLPFEFMMNALRLTEGVEARLFAERTGVPVARIAPILAAAAARGLVEHGPARIAPTARGRLFLNDLLQMFL
ncbi:MAG: oxygen-independent coproporphyrinogen III oxidase-like protein [Burkholderiales bacterium]|nr:oxygen-independent coproporphyrinogen III oxidase-like protein [Burkholderiales bacterium]